MKQLIVKVILVLVISILVTTVSMNACGAEVYPNCGVVTKLDYQEDIVYFTDCVGIIWGFYGIEDWQLGDVVAVIMDDVDTEIIYDDEIIMAVYCGRATNWVTN